MIKVFSYHGDIYKKWGFLSKKNRLDFIYIINRIYYSTFHNKIKYIYEKEERGEKKEKGFRLKMNSQRFGKVCNISIKNMVLKVFCGFLLASYSVSYTHLTLPTKA